MTVREVRKSEQTAYNKTVNHIIQSWEWGEFRKRLGLELVRLGQYRNNRLTSACQLTFHSVPFFKYTIGYLPKGPIPNKTMVDELTKVGIEKKAAFVKFEPLHIRSGQAEKKLLNLGLVPSKKSLFTKYNFLVDLTQSEDQLLSAMHQKTRYNINIAKKKGVEVYESTKDSDFEIYLKLYFETTKRQKYFGHTPHYHKLLWQTLKPADMARILIGKYEGKPLVAWMLFNFHDTLYYPYGGSSTEHKEFMASNLVAWEAIRLGKKMEFKTLDMWGALSPDANESDAWYGFHRFKAGYGPKHVEYVGTFDLVLKPQLYGALNIADKIRWTLLRATRG